MTDPPEPIDPSDREFVGSLAKGLKILKAFRKGREEMTVAEAARATEMTRAAARRLLLTLQALGYVETDGKRFSLTPKVLELGFSYLSSRSWLVTASPILEQLRAELRESVSVTVLEGHEVVYIAKFPADRVMTMAMDVGSRRPAYCSAMGRVLMAEETEDRAREILARSNIAQLTPNTVTDPERLMEEIRRAREQGYSLIDQELEPGLVAISAPLRNTQGRALAAVNVCGHSSHLSPEDLETRCLDPLRSSLDRIAQALV